MSEEQEGQDMKIAVIGGTGLIGSRLVRILNARGHEAVPHSRSTGVDLLTGRGLPEALAGADVVVNLTKPQRFDDASPAFFRTTMNHLLTEAAAAGVGHAVILSIVGADLVPSLVYYQAKVLQEDLLKAGPVPYSIVRSTQFFEFIDTVLSWTSDEHTVRLPATLMQPMAADDVARAVADISVGVPLRGTRDIAGPEVFALDELGRITLAARGDRRTVVTDDGAGMYAAAPGRALVAKDGAVIAETTYREWLAR
ncbi:SDR family oxidoreductase [Microbispora hainanensis]|uniref:SDR family oxidoreductase n=1 Tax=Microbispora hainanensis TaxID=568844 RepID=UPI0033FCBA65